MTGICIGDQHTTKVRQRRAQGIDHRQESRRHHGNTSPAVLEHVGIVVLSQQRIDGYRDGARLDAAQEHHREIDGVVHAHENALLSLDSERAQDVGEGRTARIEFPKGQGTPIIDISDFIGQIRAKIALDQIVSRVIYPWDMHMRRTLRTIHMTQFEQVCPA